MKKDLHANWPEPPQTLSQRLRHTLDIYEGESGDQRVLDATTNTYAPYGEKHSWTGITLADLRTLAEIMLNRSYTLADHDLRCQFVYTGKQGPRSCFRCDLPQDEYEGDDCPRWDKALR